MTDPYVLDNVQSHMAGLIVSIMNNYSLSVTDIVNYIQCMESYQTQPIDPEYVQYTPPSQESSNGHEESEDSDVSDQEVEHVSVSTPVFDNGPNYVHHSWASDVGSDVMDLDIPLLDEPTEDKKMYVAHRRAFRDALSEGIKICSNYTDCHDNHCTRFHVLSENLCPHAGRNNYCDHTNCDKIVIKACRKGRRCNDTSCSFRH
jgi:uncharacterized protein YifE (UPF0438 family)